MKRRRIEVNLKELDQVLEGARQAPLTDPDYEKLKTALHALGDALTPTRTTEKTHPVLGKKDERSSQEKAESKGSEAQSSGAKAAGHGRNGSAAFESAQKVETKHRQLKPGDGCPECPTGKVYAQKEPRTLIRVVGQAPIQATAHELERLRGNLCGQVFTAEPPEGVGPEKYDETVASMGKATGFSILPGRGDSAG